MLKYRMAIDVYLCFVKLTNAHLRAELFNPENRERIVAYLKRRKPFCHKYNCKCLSDLGLLYLRNCSDLAPIVKATKEYERGGTFSNSESVKLLEMAMDQRETSDIGELKSENLDWGRMASALKRQAYSVRVHYDFYVWQVKNAVTCDPRILHFKEIVPNLMLNSLHHRTPLARLLSSGAGASTIDDWKEEGGFGSESVLDGWKGELCRAILADETVRERRGIRWQEMSRKFPDVALNAMIQFVGNCIKKPAKGRSSLTFRELIQSYDGEMETRNSKKAFKGRLSRVDRLWSVYCNRREQYAAEDNKLLELKDL